MDQKLQHYYEELFNTFSSPGWAYMTEDIEKMLAFTKDLTYTNTEQDLFVNKGRMDILNWILNFKGVAEQAYEQLSKGEQ